MGSKKRVMVLICAPPSCSASVRQSRAATAGDANCQADTPPGSGQQVFRQSGSRHADGDQVVPVVPHHQDAVHVGHLNPVSWRCRRVVMGAEFGADLIAVGVVDLLEDPLGLGPGLAGRGGIAGAEVNIAEAVKGVGLVETVAVSGEVKGLFVACDGLLEVAAMVMDVAQAVPDGTLHAPFPHLPHQPGTVRNR